MRPATFTDPGLRILMHPGHTPGKRSSTAALAVQLGVSHHNLTKVVQDLMRRGFITARPGAAVAA